MKYIQKYLLISAALLSTPLGLYAEPQVPFSPCSTDAQTVSLCKVVVHNDFPDALREISECFTDVTQTKPTKTDTDTINNNVNDRISDNEMSHVTIQVNKKLLQTGKNIAINVTEVRPLKITLIGPVHTMLGYLIKFDLLDKIENPLFNKFKQWTASLIAATYSNIMTWINKGKNAKQAYEENKAYILAKYAQACRDAADMFGGKCRIEIIINADKLRNDLIENPETPMISFYKILDEVMKRMDEPDRFKYNGSMYSPEIQII